MEIPLAAILASRIPTQRRPRQVVLLGDVRRDQAALLAPERPDEELRPHVRRARHGPRHGREAPDRARPEGAHRQHRGRVVHGDEVRRHDVAVLHRPPRRGAIELGVALEDERPRRPPDVRLEPDVLGLHGLGEIRVVRVQVAIVDAYGARER